MPISVPTLRAILLVATVLQVLWTLAPLALRRSGVDRTLAVGGSTAHAVPQNLRALFLSRVPGLLLALLALAVWWLLGTPTGEAFFLNAMRSR
jgi:hypothetical protein